MRYHALACDYDGTIAHHGVVDTPTLEALGRLRASGRKLVLITGRELPDLERVLPHLDLFDRVVAENGALLYHPATREETTLGESPPAAFPAELRRRGVDPLSVGRVIVATWHPNETTVMEVIRDLGLELQIIFNKGAVMVLPSGINKATGLVAALNDLGLSPHNAIGVGDAENDHAFLALCECAVAVANALPMLKERADLVTEGHHGLGVAELIDRMVATDLEELAPRLQRHRVLLGRRADGELVTLSPYGSRVLLAGSSGGGKSTLAQGVVERLATAGYQLCIIDPEGDYTALEGAVVLGDGKRAPGVHEVLELLHQPRQHAVVNLLGLPLADRPAFFARLLPHLVDLRQRTARPHWLLVDEAHHMLSTRWADGLAVREALAQSMLITVHPEHMPASLLEAMDVVLAPGQRAAQTLRAFCQAVGQEPPALPDDMAAGEALCWGKKDPPVRFEVERPRGERRRHVRKYAEGELGPDKSFYFRGPGGRLKLRAHNLITFVQLAEGVDDDTWTHHLRAGHYSEWFREAIKDDDLAAAAEAVEREVDLTPEESRSRLARVITDRYTQPA